MQVIYPFVDPVSRSKAEFITTADYEPAKAGRQNSSSWFNSSSGSSWFGSSKSSKSSKSAASIASSDNDADVDIVVEEDQQGSDFKHFLSFYNTPYELQRHQQLLTAAGM